MISFVLKRILQLNKVHVSRRSLCNVINLPPNRTDLKEHLPGKELRIPVPWGYIAAKEYGSPSGMPVLALHGWLENSGSFDPLIPYLLEVHNLHIVAFDESGCGLSSHKPLGCEYSTWSALKDARTVMQYMKWNEVTLLGHSKGGTHSLLLAGLLPQMVKRLISVDAPKTLTFDKVSHLNRIRDLIDKSLAYDDVCLANGNKAPSKRVSSKDELIQRLLSANKYSLSENSLKTLLKRGAKECKDGFVLAVDRRLLLPPIDPREDDETALNILSAMKCDFLLISIDPPLFPIPEDVTKPYFKLYKSNCKSFVHVIQKGTHHAHMNDPDLVAEHINRFLAQTC